MKDNFDDKRKTLLSYRDLRAKRTRHQVAGKHLALVADAGSFREFSPEMETEDPLGFDGYAQTLASARARTGRKDACIAGIGTVNGIPAVLTELCREFMMGSMGTVAGEKLTRSFEEAEKRKLPLVIFSASGGARMQEGMFSLMQMVKTSAAARRFSDGGGLYISVLTNPTTGGVSASYASLGDIILAEPDALIGFAGPRVIEQTIGEKLPKGFQRSGFQLEHGFVDRIVKPADMKGEITRLLELHGFRTARAAGDITEEDWSTDAGTMAGAEQPAGAGNAGSSAEDRAQAEQQGAQCLSDDSEAAVQAQYRKEAEEILAADRKSAYDHVMLARDQKRPKVTDFIAQIFEDFTELDGDRLGKEDAAILGGIGLLDGRPVTVIGHRKGKNLQDNMVCNFGMPEPQGYRKALRLMRQAEKFGRPVVTFVDTPGAYPGREAEENGQSAAIAECLAGMSALRVPVLVIVTGEGNSGGALAISVGDSIWMLENSVYSVLSPEGFASILWKDSGRMKEACAVMKMTAAELVRAGIADRVIREPAAGIEQDFASFCGFLKAEIAKELDRLSCFSSEALTERRYEKYRRIGRVKNGADGGPDGAAANDDPMAETEQPIERAGQPGGMHSV